MGYPKAGQDRFGTAEEAAEWVAYCNDPDNALRKAHGVSAPYNLRYWQIGNETSYDKRGYGAAKSAEVAAKFAKVMRAVDPSLKLLGWGDDFRRYDEKWAQILCETAGDDIDIVAYHYHYETYPREHKDQMQNNNFRKDPDKTWDFLMEMYKYMADRIYLQVRNQEGRGRYLHDACSKCCGNRGYSRIKQKKQRTRVRCFFIYFSVKRLVWIK